MVSVGLLSRNAERSPGKSCAGAFLFGAEMSRSRKKYPITGITMAETDKPFKQQEHQRERSAVRDALRTDKEIIPSPREFGDPCKSMKDGKTMWTENQEKAKRK